MWPEGFKEPQMGGEHPEGELAAFALNALDDAEFQAVFHHVIGCLHCQEVLLGFQETAARLTEAAPETPLPAGLRDRVLAGALGRMADADDGGEGHGKPAPVLPPPDARWSLKRLRRWVAPVAIGALSLLLAASVGFMVSQQREIDNLSAANESMQQQMEFAMAALPPPAPAEVPAPVVVATEDDAKPAGVAAELDTGAPVALRSAGRLNLTHGDGEPVAVSVASAEAAAAAETERVEHVKQEMSDMVEATVLSAQPETEKLPMTSPMGTEPEARGILMFDPSGRHGVLMVSGMPADSYQIWLMRGDKRTMVDRIVVNENDGSGVKQLELDESVFGFHEVALMPDERHGPTKPTGEKFLTARIISGPPVPASVWRGR